MGTKGTPNHVYFLDEVLGVGSSASVYVGRNKKSGQLCAVKVYSDYNSDQKREYQTMQMLNHENIIKFISVEMESVSRGNVLIMELGTGGNVLTMLEKPEFAFGFPEEEFLVFLKDTTAALKYLRENNIVHRDIKPGNILRFIKDDMSSQYKITDFGAARELDNSDQFVSIYGTEEYLEPMVYEQALLTNAKTGKGFTALVDLWSLGVTLYHVATGQLPFQAFGGRKNKYDMFSITSKKQSGVISGIQLVMDGPIEWSEDLPETCFLSMSLKRKLKKILANLLETNTKRRWSFDEFFRHSMDMTSRKAFKVILISEFTITRFYASPENIVRPISNFKNFLESESKLFSPSTMTFYHPLYLSMEEILTTLGESSLSPSSMLRPHVFIFPESDDEPHWNNVNIELSLKAPQPLSRDPPSMSLDFQFSTKSLAYISFLERKIESFIQLVEHLDTFIHSMWNDFVRESSKPNEVSENFKKCRKFTTINDVWNSRADKYIDINKSCLHETGHINLAMDLLSKPQDFPVAVSYRDPSTLPPRQVIPSTTLPELIEENTVLHMQMSSIREKITMQEKRKFVKIGEDMSEIVQRFRKQADLEKKDLSRLTHNELQIHKFDKKRILKLVLNAEKYYKVISCHVVDYCSHFKSWFRFYIQSKKLSTSISAKSLKPRMKSPPLVTNRMLAQHISSSSNSESASLDDLEESILEKLDSMDQSRGFLSSLVQEHLDKNDELRKIFSTWEML